MSSTHAVHCIVDDTALTANITEIETWVARGAITLVIPLYSRSHRELLQNSLTAQPSSACMS